MMPPPPELLTDLVLKSTLVLALGLLAVALLARRRPALAASAGYAATAGLWLLPLALVACPALVVRCLPAGPIEQSPAPAIVDAIPEPLALPLSFDPAAFPVAAEPSPPEPAPVPEPTPARAPAEPWTTPQLIGLAYAGVAALVLLRLAGSLAAVARLDRAGVPNDDPAWTGRLAAISSQLGLRPGRVRLAWSDRVGVPVVVGWSRPLVLLPSHLREADPDTCAEAVLFHELAHIRRNDYPWNIVLRLTVAAYWPHPLAWLFARVLSDARERACDAYCIHALGGPSAYSDALLAVVSARLSQRAPAPSLGLAMPRPTRLRRRLARIAHTPAAPRCSPTRWEMMFTLYATLALAALLGPLQLARVEAEPIAEPLPAQKPIDPPTPTPAGREFVLRVVSAETGKPVAGADVRLSRSLMYEMRKTDADGVLRIRHSTGAGDRRLAFNVIAKGFALQSRAYFPEPGKAIPDGETVRLRPGETLGGFVKDERGRPISGALVTLWSHKYTPSDPNEMMYDLPAVSGPDGRWETSSAPKTTGELLGIRCIHPDHASIRLYSSKDAPPIADLRAGKGLIVLKKGVPIEGRVTDKDGKPVAGAEVVGCMRRDHLKMDHDVDIVRTDADGRYRLGHVAPGSFSVVVQSRHHAPAAETFEVGTESASLDFVLDPPNVLRGRVVDPDGKPLADAQVNLLGWNGYRLFDKVWWTDQDGRFVWENGPRDGVKVSVSRLGYNYISLGEISSEKDEHVFTLSPMISASGRLKDAVSGKPIQAGRVSYRSFDRKTGAASGWVARTVDASHRPGEVGSVNDGEYRLGIYLEKEADRYQFRIEVDGYEEFLSEELRYEVPHRSQDIKLQPLGSPNAK